MKRVQLPKRQIPCFEILKKGWLKKGQWPWIAGSQPHQLRGAKFPPCPPLNKRLLPCLNSKGSAKRVPVVLWSGTTPLMLPIYLLKFQVSRLFY